MTKKPQPVFSFKPEASGFTILRDQEPLQTPRNLAVIVPTQKLAEAIVEECVGQGERLDLRKMPMTQMTLTALDIATAHRGEVIDGIMRYGESEHLCQRALEPDDLVAEQNKVWQPYLDWCRERFGADLRIGSGIVPFTQSPQALGALRTFVETFDTFPLIGVSEAVGICGSLVLGLALVTGYADVETILKTAELDHLWQAKKWGTDPATENRYAGIKRDLEDCARWLLLLD